MDLLQLLDQQEWAAKPGECGHVWASFDCLCREPVGHTDAHRCSCGWMEPRHTGENDCPRCEGGYWRPEETVPPHCTQPTDGAS